MANLLKFLSESDQRRLVSVARRERFEPEAVILREGTRHHALFIVHRGTVRVEHRYDNFSIEISRLGPGEVFGEMSFVEGLDASASVVADSAVEIDIIEQERVQRLIDEDPGFYGRFYQSLAETLSRRLRETTVRSFEQFTWGGRVLGRADEEGARRGGGDAWGGGSPFAEPADKGARK